MSEFVPIDLTISTANIQPLQITTSRDSSCDVQLAGINRFVEKWSNYKQELTKDSLQPIGSNEGFTFLSARIESRA